VDRPDGEVRDGEFATVPEGGLEAFDAGQYRDGADEEPWEEPSSNFEFSVGTTF